MSLEAVYVLSVLADGAEPAEEAASPKHCGIQGNDPVRKCPVHCVGVCRERLASPNAKAVRLLPRNAHRGVCVSSAERVGVPSQGGRHPSGHQGQYCAICVQSW